MIDLVPGDSVVVGGGSFNIDSGRAPGLGNYTLTYDAYFSLPPELQIASIPPHVGWLVGGVLIGFGMKMSRRRA